MSSNIAERKETILRMLAEDQSISVSALSKQLGVTVVTTRSDLATLEASLLLIKVVLTGINFLNFDNFFLTIFFIN